MLHGHADGQVALAGQTAMSKKGAMVSQSVYLSKGIDDNCEADIIQFPNRKTRRTDSSSHL
jgi:hypothetical protein